VRLLLAGILVVAAALRLTTLGSVPGFDGDEGIGLFYARQVAEHAHFELHPLRPYLGPYKLWLAVPFLLYPLPQGLFGPSDRLERRAEVGLFVERRDHNGD